MKGVSNDLLDKYENIKPREETGEFKFEHYRWIKIKPKSINQLHINNNGPAQDNKNDHSYFSETERFQMAKFYQCSLDCKSNYITPSWILGLAI